MTWTAQLWRTHEPSYWFHFQFLADVTFLDEVNRCDVVLGAVASSVAMPPPPPWYTEVDYSVGYAPVLLGGVQTFKQQWSCDVYYILAQ